MIFNYMYFFKVKEYVPFLFNFDLDRKGIKTNEIKYCVCEICFPISQQTTLG